jgi:hypothetical protein
MEITNLGADFLAIYIAPSPILMPACFDGGMPAISPRTWEEEKRTRRMGTRFYGNVSNNVNDALQSTQRNAPQRLRTVPQNFSAPRRNRERGGEGEWGPLRSRRGMMPKKGGTRPLDQAYLQILEPVIML